MRSLVECFVTMGFRPGGISSITLTSRSPYIVMARVRGRGVVVLRVGKPAAPRVVRIDHALAAELLGELHLQPVVVRIEDGLHIVDRGVAEVRADLVQRGLAILTGEGAAPCLLAETNGRLGERPRLYRVDVDHTLRSEEHTS